MSDELENFNPFNFGFLSEREIAVLLYHTPLDVIGMMRVKRFQNQLRKGSELVRKFCEEMRVKLLGIDATRENKSGRYEPTYTFSDDLGYYTLEGLRASLTR